MSGFLLDTNVLSEFNRKGAPDERAKRWLEAADSESLYASVLTLSEIRFGIEFLPHSKRREQLVRWLEYHLQEWFEGRILPVDQLITDRWGSQRAQAQLKGRTLSVIDALLAATALQHNLTIVSRNASDLAVVNRWEC